MILFYLFSFFIDIQSFCMIYKLCEVIFLFQIALKKLREKAGISQYKLAELMGVSQSTIGMWESGKNKPEYSNLQKLATIFNVPFDELIGTSDANIANSRGVWIPVLGKVQAGLPVEAVEEILDYEEITKEMAAHGEHFALQIKGDSMEPRFVEGDVVIVRQTNDCSDGDIVVVLVNGDEATVKRIKKMHNGIMLIPNNHNYVPMFYSNEEIEKLPVKIIGKVVELRAKF